MKRIIIICVIVVIVMLAYTIFVFNQDWVYMLMLVSTSFITSIITSLIINKKERHQEPNPTLPYNAPDSHPLIDMKTEVIPVKREMNSAMKSYIEVLIKGDEIDMWHLEPGVCEKFHIGDKIVVNRGRINESDFMLGLFSYNTRKVFFQNENRYFGSSNRCFIQITEKIFHENRVEFHGKIVPEDGLFYSK